VERYLITRQLLQAGLTAPEGTNGWTADFMIKISAGPRTIRAGVTKMTRPWSLNGAWAQRTLGGHREKDYSSTAMGRIFSRAAALQTMGRQGTFGPGNGP